MARTVEECLALAAASRAAAAAETLENVRRVHLEAAVSWETLAERAQYVAFPCERATPSRLHPGDAPETRHDRAMAEPVVAPPSRADETPGGDALIVAGDAAAARSTAGPVPPSDGGGIILYSADGNLRTLEEIEADVIRLAIDVYRGRMAEVARRLGIGRSTLYRKLSDFGIDGAARPDGTMGM